MDKYKLGKIDAKLDILISQQQKTIFALIALVAATIGVKFLGTTPLQYIMFYTKAFIFAFIVLISWFRRDVIRGWYLLFGFGIFGGAAQILNLAYHSEMVSATILFLICNIILLIYIINLDNFHTKEKVEK